MLDFLQFDPPDAELVDFYRGYLICATWATGSTHPFSGELLESLVEFEPSPAFQQQAWADCKAFWQTHFARMQNLCIKHYTDWVQMGHDFWLTRNGHGSGFWDRGYGSEGQLLTQAAEQYSEIHLYLGDDLLIYGE
ncbi:hypothetical protein PU634_10500 [Oceanimonas pelagia]|uniref:Uncharacterized protein n=1 Tax=Oceanimonas pelagia TaxID=3028314 RepID=A0AA50KM17_9GAMM|nr:hypothetical protein [Oceanimonas pelagia]WMC09546.1 hypothetical protein PU634_10500 [Oceanimonas pelagia]